MAHRYMVPTDSMTTIKNEDAVILRPRRTASFKAKKSIDRFYGSNTTRKAGSNLVGLFFVVRRMNDDSNSDSNDSIHSIDRHGQVISFDSRTCLHKLRFTNGPQEYVNLNDGSAHWTFKKFPSLLHGTHSLLQGFPRGIGLVGRNIDVIWPGDGEFYTARVADYRERTRRHLICYIKDERVEIEEINLRRTKRQWRVLPVRQEEDHLIGKRVVFDPRENDSVEDTYRKTGCVLQSIPNDELGCRAACCNWKLSSVNMKNHTIIFVEDDFLTNVRLADCYYVLENNLRKGA